MVSKWFVFCLVLFTPALILANASSYGLFMVVKGDIKVINAQNQSNAVKVGSKIHPGETVVSGAEARAKIVMSDRNVINISPGTTLKIEKYENNPKTGEKNVLLNLQDGKARTNVEQKYDGEKSKFQIRTPTAVAGVRGTQFLVSFDSSTRMTQVVTLRGAVTFASVDAGAAAQAVMVKKGESTSVAPGAAAPEPPKVLPKEELRRLDQETASTAAPPKPAESQQANNSGGEGRNSDSKKSGTDGPNAPGANPGDVNKDGSPRSPAAVSEGGAPPPPSTMIDKKDMDTSLAKQIQPTTTTQPVATLLPPPPPLMPPPTSPSVIDVIQKQFERTKVKIVPVVQ